MKSSEPVTSHPSYSVSGYVWSLYFVQGQRSLYPLPFSVFVGTRSVVGVDTEGIPIHLYASLHPLQVTVQLCDLF